MEESAQQQQLSVSVAKDYLQNYDGPIMIKPISLGDPVMKQIYKRDAPLCQRNALFITYFARLNFRAEVVDPYEKHLLEIIGKAKNEFKLEIERLETVLKSESISDPIPNSMQIDIEAKVTSPLYREFIELIVIGDSMSTLFNTLWMHGLMESREFQSERLKIKKRIRGVNQFIRQTWLKLLKLGVVASQGVAEADVNQNTDAHDHEDDQITKHTPEVSSITDTPVPAN